MSERVIWQGPVEGSSVHQWRLLELGGWQCQYREGGEWGNAGGSAVYVLAAHLARRVAELERGTSTPERGEGAA